MTRFSEVEMPPWLYTPLHPQATLSSADKQIIQAWAQQGSVVRAKEDE